MKRYFLLLALSLPLVFTACDKEEDEDPMDETPSVQNPNLPTALRSQAANMVFSTANQGAPYSLNQEVVFTFSSDGSMAIDYDPASSNGAELTLPTVTIEGAEYVWEDSNNGNKYALSLNSDSTVSEINVNRLSDNFFYGQFTPIGSNIANLDLVTRLAGTYTVSNTINGTKDRNTVIIGTDGSIDFDTNISFAASDIQVIYDRISATQRVQVSYGANDDEEVINLYTNADGSVLERAQFRHRNQNIDIEVEF